jgi:hypothetical protein
MNYLKSYLLCALCLCGVAFAAESNTQGFAANYKYMGVTYHPGGGNGDYIMALDSTGYIVIQLGVEGDLDYYLNRYFLVRSSVSLYKDCAFVWSGFFHVGPRVNLPIGEKFQARIGIGPTLIWRENWYRHVDWYTGDGFYGKEFESGPIQTAFLWYGGNIEFQYDFNKNWAFVYSVVPGYPQVFTSSFGLRQSF